MTKKIKIEKNTVSETLVLPLGARVHCSIKYPDLFKDPEAERIVSLIDYDFKSLDYKEFVMITWVLRNRMLCDRAKSYLKAHPKATIVNMGCGADTSYGNIDNGTCHFLNIDLPEVIEARNEIIPVRDREKNLAYDAFDTSWINEIETPVSDGVFIISGGVIMFFEAEKLKKLFDDLAHKLPGGGICFDGENDGAVKRSNKIVAKSGNSGAMVRFAVNDINETFKGWSDHFASVTAYDRMPDDIARSKNLPSIPKMILKLGFKMGMIKFVEIMFKEG